MLERVPEDDGVLGPGLDLGLVDARVGDLDPERRGGGAGRRRRIDPARLEPGGAHRRDQLAVAGAHLQDPRAAGQIGGEARPVALGEPADRPDQAPQRSARAGA